MGRTYEFEVASPFVTGATEVRAGDGWVQLIVPTTDGDEVVLLFDGSSDLRGWLGRLVGRVRERI